jgi:glutathione S-transferase
MPAYPGPTLLTLASVLLLFACTAYVGRCRIKFAIKAPATSGHPQFEIAYRIQMNTLENTVAFLPVLWVFARSTCRQFWATLLGGGWWLARVWYALAYARDPKTRGPAFATVDALLCGARPGWRLGRSARAARLKPDASGESSAATPDGAQPAPRGCGRCALCCPTWRPTVKQVALALLLLLLAAAATLEPAVCREITGRRRLGGAARQRAWRTPGWRFASTFLWLFAVAVVLGVATAGALLHGQLDRRTGNHRPAPGRLCARAAAEPAIFRDAEIGRSAVAPDHRHDGDPQCRRFEYQHGAAQ